MDCNSVPINGMPNGLFVSSTLPNLQIPSTLLFPFPFFGYFAKFTFLVCQCHFAKLSKSTLLKLNLRVCQIVRSTLPTPLHGCNVQSDIINFDFLCDVQILQWFLLPYFLFYNQSRASSSLANLKMRLYVILWQKLKYVTCEIFEMSTLLEQQVQV